MGTKLRCEEVLRQLLNVEIVLGSIFAYRSSFTQRSPPYHRQCCANVSFCMMCVLDHAKTCLVNASDHLFIVLG